MNLAGAHIKEVVEYTTYENIKLLNGVIKNNA
jgi:hypothetical protein